MPLTISPPDVLIGSQRPRVCSLPPSTVSSAGAEAVELAATAGLVLDDWQAWALEQSLGERPDGKWSAFEVALIVSRQNGKGAIIEARELFGLFLAGEQLLLHTAHEFKTAQEGFRRVLSLVESTPDLSRLVKRVRTSHGEEGIELLSGARLRFVARSGGSGRGFSGDWVLFDEAMFLPPSILAALFPTLSARPNPQLWYTGSAGMDDSEQLRRVRERGQRGGDPGLAYMEWSSDPRADMDDPAAWAEANPAMGIRITQEFIERERAAMPETEFARERMGIWDDKRRDHVIDPDLWERIEDTSPDVEDPVAFALDMSPDRRYVSIGMCGRRRDGRLQVEVIDNGTGTGWVVPRVVELCDRWSPAGVALDPAGPAGSLLEPLKAAGVDVDVVSARQMAQACGAFYDDVTEDRLRHFGQPVLASALGAARKRPLGDSWAWHRKDATDISPLVAVTLARLCLLMPREPKKARSGRVY